MDLLTFILLWALIHRIIPDAKSPKRPTTTSFADFGDRCIERYGDFWGNPIVWFFAAVLAAMVTYRIVSIYY